MAEHMWISHSCECCIKISAPREEVIDHPLKPLIPIADNKFGTKTETMKSNNGCTSTAIQTSLDSSMMIGVRSNNPFGENSALDGTDPLTQFSLEELNSSSGITADEWNLSSSSSASTLKDKYMAKKMIDSWSTGRITILNTYMTSEKLSIATSFLSGGERIVKVQSNNIVDTVRTRLGHLDDFEEGTVKQLLDLSQQEYVLRIEQLNKELVQAWHSDQRVKALKIIIQCAKLLMDTAVIAFYPSKFILITDILDMFGKLVHERLKTKAGFRGTACVTLSDDINPDLIPENAKETCKNWFYKTASIRELVPRLYIEMAIIKSYSFLTLDEFNRALLRMTRMIRGIGNPLIAAYARCYLCQVGLALEETSDFAFVRENLYDFFLTYHQLFNQSIKIELSQQNILPCIYLNLYTPALLWIFRIIINTTLSENILTEVFSKCKDQNNNALLFNTILVAYKPTYIANHAIEFIKVFAECNEDSEFPQYLLYGSLGDCLTKNAPPKNDCQSIFDNVWKFLSKLNDTTQFIYCVEKWIEFVVVHFSIQDLDNFLGEIINNVGSTRSWEQYYVQLQLIIGKIVSNTHDLESLLTAENFLPLIDLLHKENIKVEISKCIVKAYSIYSGPITDPIIINALMFICRIMHDSVNALTINDERRQIGALISGLIQRVYYGRDFEKLLNFYAEARATFPNIDSILIQLVQCVNQHAVNTRKIVKGHHTRRTAAFVRACAAFCYITIPSLTFITTRLQLYLLSGQVALMNQCLGQADACFKAALSLIPEMPKILEIDGRAKKSEPYILSYLSNFLSTLLIVPDSPEFGVLYLIRGLLNAIQRYFDENSAEKYSLYLRVLDLLSAMTYESYPYHVDKVDSNDRLYGGNEKFIGEVNKISMKILDDILDYLQYMATTIQYEKQSYFVIELFGRLITRADLRQSLLADIAVRLWKMLDGLGCTDPEMKIKMIEYVKHKSQQAQFVHLIKILKDCDKDRITLKSIHCAKM